MCGKRLTLPKNMIKSNVTFEVASSNSWCLKNVEKKYIHDYIRD